MASLNKVFLWGNLTREVDLRHLQSGDAVCEFGLAVSRKFTSNGQQQEEVCFVDISAWGKTAENCKQYLSKGSQVMVEGRLKLDTWQDRQSGENRSKLKVLAENVQFVGGRREDNGNQNDNGNYGGYQQQQPPRRGVDSQYAPPPMPTPDMPGEGECYADSDIPF